MNEHDIQTAIVQYLKALGCVVIRLNAGLAFSKTGGRIVQCPPGTPDLLAVTPLGVFFFEVKAAKGKLSESQALMHTRLNELGQRVRVVRSVEDVRQALLLSD